MGLILINEDDPEVRRRFTKGHELAELLFFALRESRVTEDVWHHLSGDVKERLCNRAAAALLMPSGPFAEAVGAAGLTIDGVAGVARAFGVSFLAALLRAVELAGDGHLLIGWDLSCRPTEAHRSNPDQTSFDFATHTEPAEKLRVRWVRGDRRGRRTEFIPRHKSAAPDSLAVRCLGSGERAAGYEDVRIGPFERRCYVEAVPQHPDAVVRVLTLLHPD
jgi:hypothetical protein